MPPRSTPPTTIQDLPRIIPVFPLDGVLLLPRGKLPLNIFEPRYLAMVRDALAAEWIIGMVQPRDDGADQSAPPIYKVGCAGRITSLNETDDGRYLITLTGICRFENEEELPLINGYRRVAANWLPFADDITPAESQTVDRGRLMPALKRYFKTQQISADWKAIEDAPGDQLVTSLAMVCPFDTPEKQALLEAPGLAERTELMISLLTMAVLDQSGATSH